jgi:hypothetical protein
MRLHWHGIRSWGRGCWGPWPCVWRKRFGVDLGPISVSWRRK